MVHAPIWKAELGKIAKKHPKLRIIIDHMGIMARCVDDAIGYWVSETADLHVHPNIYVKVSAVPGYSTQPYPFSNISKYVREMVDKMGPRRCFWGTDLTRSDGARPHLQGYDRALHAPHGLHTRGVGMDHGQGHL
jgi:predicted TIM-barrel fold metal-dependent hydrolase